MNNYDYLVVGAGLFGATFAYEAAKRGKRVKVIEKRSHIAGNIYTKKVDGIQVHEYGAHIFHTSDKAIWEYVNQFAEFNRYTNSPVANYKGEMYNLPFNMNTFNKMWEFERLKKQWLRSMSSELKWMAKSLRTWKNRLFL